ncbi:hypothetical protein [Phytohabitans suffuscus]|uniref:Uncharacterized protein n=1 Tax=Phytohabitans suffuscus TaxID=624315 RepID=A0A6F8YFM7_9ACTN|nr:hypothetical protein Psuf_021900 [Phytohabitans suffuscus]
MGEFVFGAGEADLESFDLTEPSFAFGFGDSGLQVVADFDEPVALGWVGPEQRASDAGLTEMILPAGWRRAQLHPSRSVTEGISLLALPGRVLAEPAKGA